MGVVVQSAVGWQGGDECLAEANIHRKRWSNALPSPPLRI